MTDRSKHRNITPAPERSIRPKKDCFGNYQGVGDDRCFKCNDWGYCADISEAAAKARRQERERVLKALAEFEQNLLCLNTTCCKQMFREKLQSMLGEQP